MTELNPSVKEIVQLALDAAAEATQKYLNDHPGEWFPCGFAWVKIKPARGQFVAYLKANKLGHSSYTGGYDVWNPSGNTTQSMYAKEAGAIAFANVLQSHGVKCIVETRED